MGRRAPRGEKTPKAWASLARGHPRLQSDPHLRHDDDAVEDSDTAHLVYTCKLVEVCKSVSDPHIMGGKTLWGYRTICVGTGWVKRAH
jgi:hypothetical protein